MDIYVGNDFLSNDILYINNKDKSFTDKSKDVFKHFSLSSIGTDISDINNDGKLDVFVSEMQPYYNNKRKKLFNRQANYRREQITEKYNYSNQYLRNVLQLNLGIKKETGLPIFSEVGMFSVLVKQIGVGPPYLQILIMMVGMIYLSLTVSQKIF